MKTKHIIGLGLILVPLILLIATRSMPGSSAAYRQDAAPAPSPTTLPTMAPESTPVPTPEMPFTGTVVRESIPLCTFEVQAQPLSSTTTSSLDSYLFSEPRVVLTSTTALRLFQWLPDGHHLLIGRDVEGKAEEILEVFDLRTNETQRYAQTHIVGDQVVWLAAEQAVAFVERLPDNGYSLKLSYGVDKPMRELVTDFRSYFSTSHAGEQLIFSANTHGGQLQTLRVSDGRKASLLPQLPGFYHAVPNADETWMAVYNHLHFYLVNLISEQICEVDLGQVGAGEYSKVRASDVAWSADGRYLAMRMVYGNPEKFLGLRIIDVLAGKFENVDFNGRSAQGLDWSPYSNVLLVAVDADPDPALGNFDSLYLLDAATRDFRSILSEYQFWGAGYDGIFWSPDGKTIGVPCSDVVLPDEVREWRICVIDVEVK